MVNYEESGSQRAQVSSRHVHKCEQRSSLELHRSPEVAEVTTFGREHRNLPRSIVEICSFFCHFLSCSIPWRILEFRVSALGMYVSFLLLSSVLCGSAPAISSMDEVTRTRTRN